MTTQHLPFDPRMVQLSNIFTPAAPIRDTNLFSGRSDLLIRIVDAVNQTGMHCILFGERGCGKNLALQHRTSRVCVWRAHKKSQLHR